jgi:hypothetical protein
MRHALVLLLFSLAASVSAAEELGRLFFTPEQRAALDARRKARMPDRPTAAVASPVTRIDGYVKRSGGPSTVWLNGESVPDGLPEGPRIGADTGVSISVGESRARVRLKPGEALDRGTGHVQDVIGEGEIRVHPRK